MKLRLTKRLLKFLLIAISLSSFSCASTYIYPDYELEPAVDVKNAEPNCYEPMMRISVLDPVPLRMCNAALACSEFNALYYEELYFTLRSQVEGSGE